MEFKKNKLLICFTIVLLQVWSGFAAPIANEAKRSFQPTFNIPYSIFFEKPSHWGDHVYAYLYSDYVSPDPLWYPARLNEWPGYKMYSVSGLDNVYTYRFERKYFGGDLSHIVFSDGKNQSPAVLQEGFNLVRNGYYTEHGLSSICPETEVNPESGSLECGNYIPVYYQPNSSWQYQTITAHYKIGANGEWKDEVMTRIQRDEERVIFIDAGNEKEVTVAFNYNNEWDNNHGQDFKSYSLTETLHVSTI